MSDPPAFIQPAPMEGKGAYNRSSRVQAAGSLPAVTLLEQAARAVPLSAPPQAVFIADYGASEGRNSLKPMAVAIGVLRERLGRERPLFVLHTDLPGNDFAALFETLATDPDSYLRKFRHIRGGDRALLLRADRARVQRHAGMELVGRSMAEPHARRDSGSSASRL